MPNMTPLIIVTPIYFFQKISLTPCLFKPPIIRDLRVGVSVPVDKPPLKVHTLIPTNLPTYMMLIMVLNLKTVFSAIKVK